MAGGDLACVEKKGTEEERTFVFVDEAGFALLPAAVRTWAPRGQTPILRYRYWEHLSVISAITADGDLYTMTQDKAIDSDAVVRFLKHLLRHLSGKLLIIWDGLPAHRSRKIKDFLREGGAARVHLAQLPSYAPDLNPDEATWHYLKNVELRNVCCHSLRELRDELRKAIARLRRKPDIIQGFVRHVYSDIHV